MTSIRTAHALDDRSVSQLFYSLRPGITRFSGRLQIQIADESVLSPLDRQNIDALVRAREHSLSVHRGLLHLANDGRARAWFPYSDRALSVRPGQLVLETRYGTSPAQLVFSDYAFAGTTFQPTWRVPTEELTNR